MLHQFSMHLIVYGGNAILLRMASPATALQVAGGGDQAPYDMVDKLLQARSRGCSPLPLQNSWCVVSTDSSVDKRWEKDKATNVAARLQCCRSHRRSNFASSVLSQLRLLRLQHLGCHDAFWSSRIGSWGCAQLGVLPWRGIVAAYVS